MDNGHLLNMDTSLLQTDFPLGAESPYIIFSTFNQLNARVVTKISSCQGRWGIKQVGISFGFIFLLFANESCWGPHS